MKSLRNICFSWLILAAFFSSSTHAAEGDLNWDTSLGVPGVKGGTLANISAFAFSGSRLYAAGNFNAVGGVAATNVAQLDGTNWSALGYGLYGTRFPLLPFGADLAVLGSDLYVAGLFSNAGPSVVGNLARWDGADWQPLGTGVDKTVNALVWSGTNLFLGGYFTNAGGISAFKIARWNGIDFADIGSLTNACPGCICEFGPCPDDARGNTLATGSGGIYVGGRFTSAGGVFATNVARWDGTNWFPVGAGFDDEVYAVAVGPSGLFAGGRFTKSGTIPCAAIARFDGTNWHPLGAGISVGGSVSKLVVVGTDLYVGGAFTSAGGIGANNIAKWDGSSWSALGSGVSGGYVGALATTGTELFVGGNFKMAGGQPSTNIALWHIPHPLSLKVSGLNAVLSWPATGTNLVLESCADLNNTNWFTLSQSPQVLSNQLVVIDGLSNASRFYRLRR